MPPESAVAGFAVSLLLLPRVLRAFGPQRSLVIGLVVLAAGYLWLEHAPCDTGCLAAVLPGLLLVATGVATGVAPSFTPTTMVIASAVPASHTGLASGSPVRLPKSGRRWGRSSSRPSASQPGLLCRCDCSGWVLGGVHGRRGGGHRHHRALGRPSRRRGSGQPHVTSCRCP